MNHDARKQALATIGRLTAGSETARLAEARGDSSNPTFPDYMTAAALWQIALELDRIADVLEGAHK